MKRSLIGSVVLFGWMAGRLAVSDAAEGTATNAASDELGQLRARVDALERQAAAPTASAPAAGRSYINLGFDVLANAGWTSDEDVAALQPGGHDPSQRGFSLRNAELAIDGAVDPYFSGFAAIALAIDEEETEVELEEAYGLSGAAGHGLQVKAGRFNAEFGRQNTQHPHAWSFVDQPLVLNRMFGADGLRQNGVRLSWLAPTPFYAEAMLGVFNGEGATASSFRYAGEEDDAGVARVRGRATAGRGLEGAGDLLYVPRIACSFDVTDSQTLVGGVSAAFGPNDTGPDARTSIAGADLYWKWKPARSSGGWPFVSWQSEVLSRSFEAGADEAAGLPAETLCDWGFYSQVLWGCVPHWAVGFRGEFVAAAAGRDPDSAGDVTRLAPNVTWYPSEFSKLRLQYDHTWRDGAGDADAIWLQLEFMLGAHAAHKF